MKPLKEEVVLFTKNGDKSFWSIPSYEIRSLNLSTAVGIALYESLRIKAL